MKEGRQIYFKNGAVLVVFIIVMVTLQILKASEYKNDKRPEAKIIKSGDCVSMVPVGVFDLNSCSTVEVNIQVQDCKSGEVTDNLKGVAAKFMCHKSPMELRYWRDQTLYIGLLKLANPIAEGNDSDKTVHTKLKSYDVYHVDIFQHGEKDPSIQTIVPKVSSVDLTSEPIQEKPHASEDDDD